MKEQTKCEATGQGKPRGGELWLPKEEKCSCQEKGTIKIEEAGSIRNPSMFTEGRPHQVWAASTKVGSKHKGF